MLTYKENIKNVEEYNKLYDAVGWGAREEEHVQEALNRTFYSISAYDEDEIVGYGRIIGDATCFLYVQDIMVDPRYQGQKIGSNIMNKLIQKVKELKKDNPDIRLYVGPDYQKEGFYRKFGFQTRKEARLGDGMILKDDEIDTKIWNAHEELKEEDLEEIIRIIEEDGIIIFPTDTVYGIACNLLSENAIQRLYEIKNRPFTNPIGVLTNSVEKIEKIAEMSEKEKEMINKYMPGALTIVLKKKDIVPSILTANLDTIGVRIPNNKTALKILEKCPLPLAVTSANESEKKEGIRLQDFQDFFAGKIEGMVDGGPTQIQVASTVIKLENNKIITLREGSIKIKE